MNRNLLFLKLGGSLITDKNRPFVSKRSVIRRLGTEIRSGLEGLNVGLVIAHGSGSFGHVVAKKYQTAKGIVNDKSLEGLPRVANAAIQINRIVMECLLEAGLPVVSFAPSSLIMAEEKRLANNFIEPILKALKLKFVPVLYGDIVFDRKRGWCIFSSEKILGVLTNTLLKSFANVKVFYCGDTDGVYDEKGGTIEVITPESFSEFRKKIKGSTADDVTGGMLHKVKEALRLASGFGIETLIFSGRIKGQLRRAFVGERVNGTRISAG